MDDYIPKPLRREQLVGALQAWIPASAAVAVADGGDAAYGEGAR
jgi:hypothetical protein